MLPGEWSQGVALEPPSPLHHHGTSSPCPRERHSPSRAKSEAPLLPERSLRRSWTRTHGWHPDSHLGSSGSGWADPCCCLVSRSFLASKKKMERDFELALPQCLLQLQASWLGSADPAHPSSRYSLPPAPSFLGPSCTVLQFFHKPQDLCI